MHNLAAALLLLAIVPYGPVEDSVCQIETNNFYDLNANFVFRQYVFRSLDNDGEYQCRDWRIKRETEPYMSNGVLLFHDGNCLRRVRYGVAVESWSQTDVELLDRQKLPKELRRELSRPLVKAGRK